MTLGEKIRYCREAKGLSQEELANTLKVNKDTLWRWENDVSVPETNEIISISEALKVDLKWLLQGLESTPKTSSEPRSDWSNVPQSSGGGGVSFTAIKVWMIIGMIYNPIMVCVSIFSSLSSYASLNSPNVAVYESFMMTYGALSLLGLLYFAVTIPLGILFLKKVKNAERKSDTIAIGVLSLIFVSLIAGILILCMRPAQFPMSRRNPDRK